MGLREWLMILGGVILLLIIVDGIRRMRKVHDDQDHMDEEEKARQAQLRRELPAGKARVVKTHDVEVFDDDPIPVLCHEVDIPGFKEGDPSQSSRHSGHADEPTDFATNNAPQPESKLPPQEPVQSSELSASNESDTDIEDVNDQASPSIANSDPVAAEFPQSHTEQEQEQPSEAEDSSPDDEALETPESPDDELHITEFEPLTDASLDDLEPLVPLEQRTAEEQRRRQKEPRIREERAAEKEAVAAEEMKPKQEEDDDPVKAAARRIRGKNTGPRPPERMGTQQ